MTKHIAGLILFSFIVGTSVFVAALTGTEKTVDVRVNYATFKKKKKRKKRRRHCRNHRRDAAVSIDRVVFDKNTSLLSVTFADSAETFADGSVELSFFSKDRNGTRFLKTESLGYVDRNLEYFEEMNWLARIDESQNIFVLAKINRQPRSWNIPPRFDNVNAVPLMVSND